jgi:hemolysin III
MLSKFREPVNGFTHLGGAIIAFLGLIPLLLLTGWNGVAQIVSVLIYGISMVAMFSASATYHLAKVKPQVQQALRKLDHSAIFLLIAGTYTPFCLIAFTGFWRWGLLAIIWGIAIIGITVKLFYIQAPRWLNAVIYVIMGWLCILAAPQMQASLPTNAMAWLIVGGVIYTLGAIIYATRILNIKPGRFGFHEVWHIFVLLGAASHYISVMYLLLSRK